MYHTERRVIDEFLALRRIAVVGVSRHARDFSRMLFRTLLERGYEAIPVNPGVTSIEGRICHPRVADVDPPPEGALILMPASTNRRVIEECLAAGVKRLWLYRGVTGGAVSPEAVELCDRAGAQVVAGECPFMFLPHCGWLHSLHAGFRRMTGHLPA